MKNNIIIKGMIFSAIVCSIIALTPTIALSEPTGVTSYIDDAGIPPAGSIVFIGYYNNDDKIQTEDSKDNLNNNSGYSSITGTCLAQPGLMNGDQTGAYYTINVARPGAGKWGTGSNSNLPSGGVANTTPGTSGDKIILGTTGYVGLPQNVRAYKGNGRVVLKWDAPASGTATGYRVYRRPSATEGATEIIFDRRGTPTTLDYEDSVTNGSLEAYIICAYNATGYGPHTDEIIITADATGTDPNITAPTPTSTLEGRSINISGTNFGSSHGTIEFNGAKVTSEATVWTDTLITVTVPAGVTSGKIYVVNTTTGRISNGWTLTITTPGVPDITSCTPGKYQGDANTFVTVAGVNTNFAQGTTTAQVSGTGVTVGTVEVTSSTAAKVYITSISTSAATGGRDITLITATEVATGEGLFVITAPSFASVTPTSGYQGDTITGVAIVGTGTHFTGTPTVSFSGSNITASSVVVSDATHLTCTVAIAALAAAGARNVSVTTGGETVTGTSVFTVNTPSFTSVTPNSGAQGATLTGVAIVGGGTHFGGTTTVDFGSNITVSNVSASDATHLTCDIAIQAGAALGARNVVVTTGGETVTGTGVFTVIPVSTSGQLIYEKAGGIMMAYPNPFNPNDKANPLKMLFNTATGEAVDIYIFDTNARIIYQSRDHQLLADREARWDGETSYGEAVENGLYLIRIVQDGKLVAKGKILVIKK